MMKDYRPTNLQNPPPASSGLFMPAMFIWGIMGILLVGFLWLNTDFSDSGYKYYLLPWSLLAAIVVLAPSAYLFYKEKFDPFHPLVFGVWSYIFPAFIIGGVILTFGWSDPYYLTYVEDPEFNLPLSLMYVALGYIGLCVGFFIPFGKFLATKLDQKMPVWNWRPNDIWLPGIVLMLCGVGFNIIGFFQGLLGFQRVDEFGAFDGLVFFLVILLTEGSLLLWLGIFSTKEKTGVYFLILGLLIAIIPLKMGLQGSRGSLFSSIIPIALAYQYTGRRLKVKQTAILGGILLTAVFIGMVYGTAFRNIKGSQERTDAGDYVGQIAETLDYLSKKETGKIIYDATLTLAERIDNLSALGVAVANYEKLAPFEESFGIKNNIANDLYTSFIPRFVWPDKPLTTDARAYSDLYFNFSENSFAATPFGDLLRNFGPFGVPLGLFIIGIYFRVIYVLLIETENPAVWKKAAYYILLTVVSYEAFFATIFPTLIRTLFIVIGSLVLANLIVNQARLFRKKRGL